MEEQPALGKALQLQRGNFEVGRGQEREEAGMSESEMLVAIAMLQEVSIGLLIFIAFLKKP